VELRVKIKWAGKIKYQKGCGKRYVDINQTTVEKHMTRPYEDVEYAGIWELKTFECCF